MSKFRDLKAAFDEVEPSQLVDAGTGEGEAHFRYWMLRLLFEIAGNLDSLSASYRQMSKYYEHRAGVAKENQRGE